MGERDNYFREVVGRKYPAKNVPGKRQFCNKSGYLRHYNSCKTQIHLLISTYRGYKDLLLRSRNATPQKKVPFFEQIDKILSDKLATKPVRVLSSNTLASTESKQMYDELESEKSPEPSCRSYTTLGKKSKRKRRSISPIFSVCLLLFPC